MTLIDLTVSNIRCFENINVQPAAGLNLIVGANGSGKTTFLEAIYLLGRARSFRVGALSKVVRMGARQAYIAGKVETVPGSPAVPMGLAYQGGQITCKAQGKNLARASELALYLPLFVMMAGGHKALVEHARYRRRFMDWGVFHVEHNFLGQWQRYNRALKQRNSALAQGTNEQVWEKELLGAAEALHYARLAYLENLRPAFQAAAEALGLKGITLRYHPGWVDEEGYPAALERSRRGDRLAGITRVGPHRADLEFQCGKRDVRDFLSAGQQKLLYYALSSALLAVYYQHSGKGCTVLIDDIGAELDALNRRKALEIMSNLHAQLFVTAIEAQDIDKAHAKMFHVEQGIVREGDNN